MNVHTTAHSEKIAPHVLFSDRIEARSYRPDAIVYLDEVARDAYLALRWPEVKALYVTFKTMMDAHQVELDLYHREALRGVDNDLTATVLELP